MKKTLKEINDTEAATVGHLLLKSATSDIYDYALDKILRQKYVAQHGVDAEESINVYFNGTIKDDIYRRQGWKDKKVMIQLIEKDRYHDYPYFAGFYLESTDKVWKNYYLSNHIEAIKFLQKINII